MRTILSGARISYRLVAGHDCSTCGSGVRLYDGPDLKLLILVGLDHSFRLLLGPPELTYYEVYISQLIRFARVCSHVDDFNTRNKCLTAQLLKQGYQYHNLRKAFSKFYRAALFYCGTPWAFH